MLRLTAVLLVSLALTASPAKAENYLDSVIRAEVDEPLKQFERRFPPGFGATPEESRNNALAIWNVNTELSASDTQKSSCSKDLTEAWNTGRQRLTSHHDKFDRFRFAAALCGDLYREGEPLTFLNCNAPFRRLCAGARLHR
jgi:hypothetical protein